MWWLKKKTMVRLPFAELFQLITKQAGFTFPQDWQKATNTNDCARLRLRGAGRFWAEATPSQRSRSVAASSQKTGRRQSPAPFSARAKGSVSKGHIFCEPVTPQRDVVPMCQTKVDTGAPASSRIRYWTKTTPESSRVGFDSAQSIGSLQPPQWPRAMCQAV